MHSTAVVDLNEVRYRRLTDRVRAVRARIPDLVHAPPHWLDELERVQWGFALGEAHRTLSEVLDAHPTPTISWLHAYRSVRRDLVHLTWWMIAQYEEREEELASVLAFQAVAALVTPLLDPRVRPGAHRPRSGSLS